MSIDSGQLDLMLDTESGNPGVILRNRFPLFLQTEPKPGIRDSHHRCDVQDTTSIDQPLNFGQILCAAPGVQSAISEFADNRNGQEERGVRAQEKDVG
jgi:hypothetical protein